MRPVVCGWVVCALLGFAGCRYRVTVESRPSPAVLLLPDGRQITTPGVVDLRWVPFRKQVIEVTASGYRPLTVDLRQDEVRPRRYITRMFRSPRGKVELILVPVHGPAGTWDPEQVE